MKAREIGNSRKLRGTSHRRFCRPQQVEDIFCRNRLIINMPFSFFFIVHKNCDCIVIVDRWSNFELNSWWWLDKLQLREYRLAPITIVNVGTAKKFAAQVTPSVGDRCLKISRSSENVLIARKEQLRCNPRSNHIMSVLRCGDWILPMP